MLNEHFNLNFKQEIVDKEKFPQKQVLVYLKLKANKKSKKEIINILNLQCTYIEQRLRLYILKEMNCKNITQAVIKAYKLGWLNDIDT